jgi:thioredoxin reductase
MTRTVDVVIAGGGRDARESALRALRRGQRVLVVLRCGDSRAAQRLRRWLQKNSAAEASQACIVTNADVVCADGVDGVEAVVIRHARTGRLWAVNASAFESY